MRIVPLQEVQKEFLSTARTGQEAALDALRTLVETVQSITPKLPSPSVPFVDKLPTPEEVVASAYDFAEAVLAGQRKFAEDVVKATGPLRGGNGGSEPEAPAAS